jgi:hypothetical protein
MSTPVDPKMIPNILNEVDVSLTIPPNKTVMAPTNTMPFPLVLLAVNPCPTAVSTKCNPLVKPSFLNGPSNNLEALSLVPIVLTLNALSKDMEALRFLVQMILPL